MPKTYIITQIFIGGLLEGITYTYKSHHKREVGYVCRRPFGGSPYRVISVVEE